MEAIVSSMCITTLVLVTALVEPLKLAGRDVADDESLTALYSTLG